MTRSAGVAAAVTAGTRAAASARSAIRRRITRSVVWPHMISVCGVSMRLRSGAGAVVVLADISLDVPAGQFLAVAGPSGSGKSTLLGLIAGLDQPTSGAIAVAGVDITRLGEDAHARFRLDTVGYFFQAFHLIPTLTALENVAVPLELGGEADALARAR